MRNNQPFKDNSSQRSNDSAAQNTNEFSRRHFLKSTAIAGLSVAASGLLTHCSSHKWIRGANETVRVGIAGLRIKGRQHIQVFRRLENVRVVAICDVDRDILAREAEQLTQNGESVATFTDFRKMLEMKDLDAVVIATPNHWHSLMGVWACQAGKDVYVEKPVSYDVWEGQQLIKAGKKYKCIVQAGIQKRSDQGLIEAFDYIQQGNLGKILLTRGLCYKRRKSIGKVNGPQPIPKQIDYNLWTGPAEMGPLMRESLHYDWHWMWNTGNGDLGNQGIHEVDLCRWAMGESGLARSVQSYGGRYGYIDDGETPNTQIIAYDYKTAPLIFEVRGLPRSADSEVMDAYNGIRIGVVIHCEQGYFAGGDGGGWMYDHDGNKLKQFIGTGGVKEHAQNFIDVIRSRKKTDLRGDIEKGHVSSALCHLGNISYRLGTETEIKSATDSLSGSDWKKDAFERFVQHLENNNIAKTESTVKVGPILDFNPKTESFQSHKENDTAYFANLLLKRIYRDPFVIPERI
ncbi:Gfo/Idh/MocA family protein [bacterium]